MGSGVGGRERAQSAPVAFALLVGLTAVGAGVTLAVGGVAITDIGDSARVTQAEGSMSQFDATASRVALGESTVRQVPLGGAESDSLSVRPDDGRIRVVVVNGSTSWELANASLGAVVYRSGDARIAYQGGGVFRARGNDSRLVSPPEYHYRGKTLTLPIVRVTGGSWAGGGDTSLRVVKNGSETLFPNATLSNPLSDGEVYVEITSDYHDGWAEYFRTRTEGAVTHDRDNRTVAVNLTVPVSETFEHGVATTASGPGAISGSGTFENSTTGVDRPSASWNVEQHVEDCEAGNCADLSSEDDDGTLENGTYYHDGDFTFDTVVFDTSGGDVAVVINGSMTTDGSDQLTVAGDGNVTFYVRGSVSISGNSDVNDGGDPEQVVTKVHSDGTSISVDGNAKYVGVFYAPNSSLTINGGGGPFSDEVVGAAVVETATANGGNANLVHDASMNIELEFDTTASITYLHVTENRIDVED